MKKHRDLLREQVEKRTAELTIINQKLQKEIAKHKLSEEKIRRNYQIQDIINCHEKAEFSLGGLPFSEVREIVPKLFDGIVDGSYRIKNITENLRNFARQEKGALDENVNVNEAIKASVLTNE